MAPINIYQFIILVVLALVILGPERLPQYARTLAQWTRKARYWADDAKVRFKDETGTDFDDVDWKKYDPRQYDPRRIIREALSDEMEDLDLTGPVRSTAVKPQHSRGKSVDPLELFSAGSTGGETPPRSRPVVPAITPEAGHGGGGGRGAVAAGVAGAAAAKAAQDLPEEEQDPLASRRAPFDAEAT